MNNVIEQHMPNDVQDNSSLTQGTSETNSIISNSLTAVDLYNNEINSNDTINNSRNDSMMKTKLPWLFGEHKNPTVVSTRLQIE